MSRIPVAALSALVLVGVSSATLAADITAKKLLVKDPPNNPAKRQIQVLSIDGGITLASADNPAVGGASVHVYSATDDFCAQLPPGADWVSTPKIWKYRSTVTKNFARIGDGKLLVRIKSGVGYTLADDGAQGTVNAQIQFGASGTRYCVRCTGTKDDGKKFLGKNCAAAACDLEVPGCDPGATTTSTSTSTTSTTTSTAIGTVLQGVLPATTGLFNFNAMVGLAGADAACNTNFPGSSHCAAADLLAAEAAGDLVGITDMNGMTVTSFWAIDNTKPNVLQCGATIPWDYQTAHTGQYGERFPLNNPTGDLGPLQSGLGDGVFCAQASWVGCCF